MPCFLSDTFYWETDGWRAVGSGRCVCSGAARIDPYNSRINNKESAGIRSILAVLFLENLYVVEGRLYCVVCICLV